MKKQDLKFWKGFWDKKECKFRVVEAVVAETPPMIVEMYKQANGDKKRFPWYDAFIGQKIQMIEIHANNIIWYINNSDGKGLKKVMGLYGKDEYGHKGVYTNEVIREVPTKEWIRYSIDKEIKLNDYIENFFTKTEPFLYAKHKQEREDTIKFFNGESSYNPLEKNKENKDRESSDGNKTIIKLN